MNSNFMRCITSWFPLCVQWKLTELQCYIIKSQSSPHPWCTVLMWLSCSLHRYNMQPHLHHDYAHLSSPGAHDILKLIANITFFVLVTSKYCYFPSHTGFINVWGSWKTILLWGTSPLASKGNVSKSDTSQGQGGSNGLTSSDLRDNSKWSFWLFAWMHEATTCRILGEMWFWEESVKKMIAECMSYLIFCHVVVRTHSLYLHQLSIQQTS